MPYNRPGTMKAIHATGKTLGLDHDAIRDVATSLFHIPREKLSLSKLTDYQLSQLLAQLKHEKPGAPIMVANGATERQLWKIEQMARQLGWLEPGQTSNVRLQGFIARQCRKGSVRDLTKQDAVKVIDGLKNLLQRCTTPGQEVNEHS